MSDVAPLSDADRARVAEVFEDNRRFIEAVATSQVNGDQAEAAEIVQEVAVRLCRRLARLRSPAALQSWIYRMTINAARDRHRSRVADHNNIQRYTILRNDGPTVDPDAAAIANQEAGEVREHVRRLPGRQRAVISKRFGLSGHGDRSFPEVGAELGISSSHAHRVTVAAFDRLRESLGKQPRGQDDD